MLRLPSLATLEVSWGLFRVEEAMPERVSAGAEAVVSSLKYLANLKWCLGTEWQELA